MGPSDMRKSFNDLNLLKKQTILVQMDAESTYKNLRKKTLESSNPRSLEPCVSPNLLKKDEQ